MDLNEVMPWGLSLAETGLVAGGILLFYIGYRMLRYSLTNAVDIVKSLVLNLILFIFLCGLCGGIAYVVMNQ